MMPDSRIAFNPIQARRGRGRKGGRVAIAAAQPPPPPPPNRKNDRNCGLPQYSPFPTLPQTISDRVNLVRDVAGNLEALTYEELVNFGDIVNQITEELEGFEEGEYNQEQIDEALNILADADHRANILMEAIEEEMEQERRRQRTRPRTPPRTPPGSPGPPPGSPPLGRGRKLRGGMDHPKKLSRASSVVKHTDARMEKKGEYWVVSFYNKNGDKVENYYRSKAEAEMAVSDHNAKLNRASGRIRGGMDPQPRDDPVTERGRKLKKHPAIRRIKSQRKIPNLNDTRYIRVVPKPRVVSPLVPNLNPTRVVRDSSVVAEVSEDPTAGSGRSGYLRKARANAKAYGLDPKKLKLGDGKHKLEYDGTGFGLKSYKDFLLLSDEEKAGKIPVGTAEKKRKAYLARATKIKGDWKDNKVSPNNLAIHILWGMK
jgi:hypothetical protein